MQDRIARIVHIGQDFVNLVFPDVNVSDTVTVTPEVPGYKLLAQASEWDLAKVEVNPLPSTTTYPLFQITRVFATNH